MQVKDIASDGLIFSLDPREQKQLKMNKEQQILALKNILKAQDFDAIPLIDKYDGKITGLARQKLHDGDIYDTFILNDGEVVKMEKSSSILDAIISIIHNEHHIILLYDDIEDDKPTAILTIDLLDNPLVQQYLTLKISELCENNWHWNNSLLINGNSGSADFGIKISKEIKNLINLLRGEKLYSDRVVTKQIITILNLLQPLKNAINTPIDYEHYVKPKAKNNLDAGGLRKWPAVSIHNDDYFAWAYTLLAKANDFDEIIKMNKSAEGNLEYQLIRKKKDARKWNDIEMIKATTITGSMKLNEIIKVLKKDSERPLIVLPNKTEKWPGIITIHDLSSHQMILSNTLQKAVQVEILMRLILVNDGVLTIKTSTGTQPIVISSLSDLYRKMRKRKKIIFKPVEENIVRENRNLIAHNLISLTEVKPLPFYQHSLFLDGFLSTNKMHSELIDYTTSISSRKLTLLEGIYYFSKSKPRKKNKLMLAVLKVLEDITFTKGAVTFHLNKKISGMKEEKYQLIRNTIPKKYDNDPTWYTSFGKYLDWPPNKIKFFFKGIPTDVEE